MVSRLRLSASPPELNELLLPAPGLMSEADHVFCCKKHCLMVGEFHLQMSPFSQEMLFPKLLARIGTEFPIRPLDLQQVPLLNSPLAASCLGLGGLRRRVSGKPGVWVLKRGGLEGRLGIWTLQVWILAHCSLVTFLSRSQIPHL